MVKLFLLFALFFCGCAVNNIAPSTAGIEMDLDISKSHFRHGWAYQNQSFQTEKYRSSEDSIDRGKILFQHHCQKCHGVDGKGQGELAKALRLSPANLTNLPKDLPKSYILVQIKSGKGSMPQWKDFLTDNQVVDLTNYIIDLNRK